MDKRERLTKEIEQLQKQLDQCFETRLRTTDPQRLVILQETENKLEEDINFKKRELSLLIEERATRTHRSVLNLETELCKIDYKQAKSIVNEVVETLAVQEGGCVLFLMERCFEMEGQLLLSSLRDTLKSSHIQLKEYAVQFSPIMPANKVAFLKVLGEHLGIVSAQPVEDDASPHMSALTRQIIQCIAGLLRSGVTVFIPLSNWKTLGQDYQAPFLDWLVHDFWQALTDAVDIAMREHSPRVVFVIMVDEQLAPPCMDLDCFCDGSDYECHSVLSLPLLHWRPTDVSRWLSSYSSKLVKSQRNHFVKTIFNNKEKELPHRIRIELEKAHEQSIF